ncbi:hypothetical protein [Candidatus Palauibacter sp.]|uniref:hypothetical protein n=1 Tax=Candidatus Palauibacter sp. TaxID=3101350 RepID=UPI003B5934D6
MPKSQTDARTDRSRATDGITIALTVLTGAFTLVWDETATLGDTQVELVSRVSRLEVEVTGLRREVTDLREEMRQLGDLIRAREALGTEAQ